MSERHDVFALAEALTETLFGTPLAIRVTFADEPLPTAPTRATRPLAYAKGVGRD